jgi:hypothetical protein
MTYSVIAVVAAWAFGQNADPSNMIQSVSSGRVLGGWTGEIAMGLVILVNQPVQEPARLAGPGDGQCFACSGGGHEQQGLLPLDIPLMVQGIGLSGGYGCSQGKVPGVSPDDRHRPKFKAFGAVHRHRLHAGPGRQGLPGAQQCGWQIGSLERGHRGVGDGVGPADDGNLIQWDAMLVPCADPGTEC